MAARCYAAVAVATDVNPRALRFVSFNAALNGLATKVAARVRVGVRVKVGVGVRVGGRVRVGVRVRP